jgi:hypothetical protein
LGRDGDRENLMGIESEGYTIIANIGDQPDPFYRIP